MGLGSGLGLLGLGPSRVGVVRDSQHLEMGQGSGHGKGEGGFLVGRNFLQGGSTQKIQR